MPQVAANVHAEQTDILPFARQPTEPVRAWAAFSIYRDLGPSRSLDAVTTLLKGDGASSTCPPGKRRRTRRIQEWSRTWSWYARAAAWDAYLDERVQQALIDQAVEMAQRHATAARAIQERAVRRLLELDPAELRPADVVRWLVAGCRLEVESLATLTRLAGGGGGAAPMVGDADAGPGVIVTRSEASVLMAEPEADVAALPFVKAMAG